MISGCVKHLAGPEPADLRPQRAHRDRDRATVSAIVRFLNSNAADIARLKNSPLAVSASLGTSRWDERNLSEALSRVIEVRTLADNAGLDLKPVAKRVLWNLSMLYDAEQNIDELWRQGQLDSIHSSFFNPPRVQVLPKKPDVPPPGPSPKLDLPSESGGFGFLTMKPAETSEGVGTGATKAGPKTELGRDLDISDLLQLLLFAMLGMAGLYVLNTALPRE